VDHLARPQLPQSALDEDPFERLLRLLTSARLPNVSVKLGGAPTMSRALYPYLDLWPSLLRVVDVFGPQRLMSASDVPGASGCTPMPKRSATSTTPTRCPRTGNDRSSEHPSAAFSAGRLTQAVVVSTIR
jgi:predicted TIM-barrel fold metal-dependent hydrolase